MSHACFAQTGDRFDRFRELLRAGKPIRRSNWRQYRPPVSIDKPPHTERASPRRRSEEPAQQELFMDEAKIPFDKRIDQIGMAAELQKNFADALKSSVKVTMLEKSAERAEGDFFDAVITTSTSRSIDPEDLFRLLKQEKITSKQFLSALKVNVDKCEEFLSRVDVEKLATRGAPTTTLRISRKKGVTVALVDCLKAIGSAIST